MAQVIGLLTGAAPETGFGGLGGRYRRQGRGTFDPALAGRVRFRRLDTGAAVEVRDDPAPLPPAREIAPLMVAGLRGEGTPEDHRRFGARRQARVRDLLSGDPARVIRVATPA
jgi:hypothetical protein